MARTAIKISHVSKSFKLPHERITGLKQAILQFRPRGRQYEQQHVLRDIDFEIKQGEFFAIVGRNGSGKSTLLKLLAQIYTPDKGAIDVHGTLVPFIELGVGFNPELTGRENIYLNGALLGMDRREVNEIYNDIVAFAELDGFMDQKLKNYSSGMQVRLAFSIAIRAKSEILLIDEVLAVGDAAFQQKCFDYFDRLKREKRTIVFVSHDMSAVKQFCDRAVLIDKGELKMIGDVNEIARAYDRLNYDVTSEPPAPTMPDVSETITPNYWVKAIGADGKTAARFEYGQNITFRLGWKEDAPVSIAGIVLSRGSEVIFATNTIDQVEITGKRSVEVSIKATLGNGRYHVMAGFFGNGRFDNLAMVDGAEILIFDQPLKGQHDDEWEGLHYLDNTWTVS